MLWIRDAAIHGRESFHNYRITFLRGCGSREGNPSPSLEVLAKQYSLYHSYYVSWYIFRHLAAFIPAFGLLGIAWAGCDRISVILLLCIASTFGGAAYAGKLMLILTFFLSTPALWNYNPYVPGILRQSELKETFVFVLCVTFWNHGKSRRYYGHWLLAIYTTWLSYCSNTFIKSNV